MMTNYTARIKAFQVAVDGAAKLQKNLKIETGKGSTEPPVPGSVKHSLAKIWNGNPSGSPAHYEKTGKADEFVMRFAEWILGDAEEEDE